MSVAGAKAVGADSTRYLVVVDDEYELHVEACAYLAGMRAADRVFNTEATYAPRLAPYLSWSAATGDGLDAAVGGADEGVSALAAGDADPAAP